MFWTSVIVGFIGLLWLLLAPTSFQGELMDKPVNLKKYCLVFFIPALVFLVLSCFTVVGTRNVGVPTVFGKTTGDTYGAGLHAKAPWENVTDVDATIKPEEYRGDSCIRVKIADGGDACVSVAYRWRINKDHADVAFADYRNAADGINEGIRKALVSTNIKAAINQAFGSYDPLGGADVKPDMTPEELANVKVNVLPDYNALEQAIKANVEEKIASLGGLIRIESVTISNVKLPDSTQNRINAVNQAVQDTKVALQQIATKAAQAEANEKLARSLKDPNVLVAKCFDGLISGEIANQPGFYCWPGGGGATVIPGTR